MTEAQLNAAISLFRIETEDLIPAVLLKYYFNGGTPNYLPYTDTAEALSIIGINWKPFMTVNVAGIDYWFLPDGSLVNKAESLSIDNGSIILDKLANLPALTVIGNATGTAGTPQAITIAALRLLLNIPDATALSNKVEKVEGSSLITNALKALIHEDLSDDTKVDAVAGSRLITEEEAIALSGTIPMQKILLPASDNVSARILGASLPAGWVISAVDGTDLLITHILEGKEVAFVNVYTIEGTVSRMLPTHGTGYSGVTNDGLNVLIEGLTNIDLQLRIELLFNTIQELPV